ncbi:MAG TPA: OmpA family protein [Polyangiaceae bacterium]|nr:OmpA family protein [Polyangiaceae bacterium]
MRRELVAFAAFALGLAFAARDARAQTKSTGFALDRFEPSERGSEWFSLDTLDFRGHLRPAAGIVADYGYKPLVFTDAGGNETRALVTHQLFVHVGGSLVLWDRLRLGVNLPVAALVDGSSGSVGGAQFSTKNGANVGDLRVSADVRLFGKYRSVVSGALGASVWVPTGSQGAFTGDGKVRVSPHFAVAGESGSVAYAARVGFNYRAESGDVAGQAVGSEMFWAASVGVRLSDDKLLLGPEAYGSTVVEKGDLFAKRGSPVEAVLGAHYLAAENFRIGAGVGPGLTQGFGTPKVRVLASLEWVPGYEEPKAAPPPEEPADTDGDGIVDDEDACPKKKGVRSDDPDKNGCPLPGDRDRDGIKDPEDACPDEKGVKNEDPDKNGCPPSDRDKDEILDDDDACPDEPGVPSDDPKKNGCPKPKDTDGDGVLDPEDACVKDPGPRSDDPKRNGCPVAHIEQGQIRILEQVQFKTGSDVILPASDHVLSAVLTILNDHAEITKISVEGHTDNRGAAGYNKALSKRRAASVVRWLVSHGVSPKRLTSEGFGMERPLDENSTEEGRQKNRRVEFHIREIDGKPADSDDTKE